MTIEERMVRNNNEDQMEIGSALEDFYNSSAGTIFRAMANAITNEQFTGIDDIQTSADRKLGRAEGIHLLIQRIEYAIQDKTRLTSEIKEDQKLEG